MEAFFSWSGQGLCALRNFYHFNYIHDHDIINIVLLWCAHLPIVCLAPAFDSAQAPACAKSSNVATPLIFNCGLALWINYPAKKWSGQNRTSRTGSAAPELYGAHGWMDNQHWLPMDFSHMHRVKIKVYWHVHTKSELHDIQYRKSKSRDVDL